jgi:hypothetical protein
MVLRVSKAAQTGIEPMICSGHRRAVRKDIIIENAQYFQWTAKVSIKQRINAKKIKKKISSSSVAFYCPNGT